jgi:tRNA (adenine-N(1)-)-methyltransferase non-catalytic subunit
MMTSRGGAEGYLFTATRVLPVEGRVEARGHHGKKKRKVGGETGVEA